MMKKILYSHKIKSLIFILSVMLVSRQLHSQVYCWPNVQMACFYGDKITNVTFAGINHTDNECSVDQHGQKNFTATVSPAQVTIGQSYQLSVSVENALSTGTEYVRIWIDFNKNYTFDSNESFDLGVGTGNTTLTATIPVPAGAVTGTTRMRVMYRRTNALNAADACHTYGSYRGQAKDYAVTINGSSACTGALSPGNTISTLSSACPGENFTLSLQNTVSGTTFQWQSSADGTSWSNIAGATNATLTTSHATATHYRCIVTCSGNTGNSNAFLVNSGGPVYTTLPVNESFENWANMCGGTTNVPGSSWLTTPATGNQSWRRDDQGASASWSSVSSGIYTPVFSAGSHSARFHTSAASSNAEGTLDLYVNCSAGNPEKQLTFDYINISGTDKLQVLISTDGGLNFSQLGNDITTQATWTQQTRTFTSTSSTVVLRLKASSDNQLSDLGIDNFTLQSVQVCNGPTNPAVSALTTVSATISWTAAVPVPVSGYEYVFSTSNATPSGSGTAISTTSYNASQLNANTHYYFFVRSACGANTFSNWVGIDFTTTVLLCAVPTSPIISAITTQSATISWTAPNPAPASGYEYVISTANNTPSGSGTALSGTSVPVSSLLPNTVYYVFIRAKCSNGNFSNWVPAYFTTSAPVGIEEFGEQIKLQVFPNPANRELFVSVDAFVQINRLVVTDLTGKTMLSRSTTQSKEMLSLDSFSTGTYLLLIETDLGTLTKPFHVIH